MSSSEPGRCAQEYERPGGRLVGDRIVRCHLQAEHSGAHQEEYTDVTWQEPQGSAPKVRIVVCAYNGQPHEIDDECMSVTDWPPTYVPLGRVVAENPDDSDVYFSYCYDEVRAEYQRGISEGRRLAAEEPGTVRLPLDAARALLKLWDTWWNKMGGFDASDIYTAKGTRLHGFMLVDQEDGALLEKACDAIEPHEALLSDLLAKIAEGVPHVD